MNAMILQTAVDEILSNALGAGFARSEVKAGEDSLGDQALFIRAFLRVDAERPSSDASLDAMVALRSQLLAAGEERQPYLDLEYPADVPAR